MLIEAVPVVNGWTSLPDDIFNHIISCIRFPQLAITVSTTSFIIKHTGKPTDEIRAYNIPPLVIELPKFWSTLDNIFTIFILRAYNIPPLIDTFRLDIPSDYYDEPSCWPIIDKWARQLRAYNIQHFTANGVGRGRSNDQVYPLSFFRMHSLVSLKLNLFDNRIASISPRSILLPNLKKLTLLWINYGFLKRFLSCCPSLEDLCLSVDKIKEPYVSLTSKKLKRLRIMLEGRYKWYLVKDFIIDAPILEELNYSSYSILSLRMLESISNIKSLTLRVEEYTIDLDSNKTTIHLGNLTRLKLTINSPEIFKAIGIMLYCPKLVVFKLHVDYYIIYRMVLNKEAVFVPVERVKHIKLDPSINVDPFGKEMLDFVTFLLRSAKVLKKLTLTTAYDDPPSPDNHIYLPKPQLTKPQFYQALFECVKATSRCQIEFLGLYKQA